jgi:hypothetical protein
MTLENGVWISKEELLARHINATKEKHKNSAYARKEVFHKIGDRVYVWAGMALTAGGLKRGKASLDKMGFDVRIRGEDLFASPKRK